LTKNPIAEEYVPKPKQKNQKKRLPKEDEERCNHDFCYIPRGYLLIQGNVAHAGDFCFGQKGQKQQTYHRCAERKNTTCLMTGTTHENILHEL